MKGSVFTLSFFTFSSAPQKEGLIAYHNHIFPREAIMTILPKDLYSQSLRIFHRNQMKSIKTVKVKVTTSRHGETTTSHNELVTDLIKAHFDCL